MESKRNEKLDEILVGLRLGNPKYDEYLDPMKTIEVAINGGASIDQIRELEDLYLNNDNPTLKNRDKFELRCAMSKIQGYYGEFAKEDNEEFREEYLKKEYGKGSYEAKYDKLIDIASKQGISYRQSANLGANNTGSYIVQPQLSFLSHDKRFPEWMVKLAHVPGCNPKKILRYVRTDPYIRRDVKIATAIALIKEFPEVAMEAVEYHGNNFGPDDNAFDEYDEDKYESFMDEMLDSELANKDGKPLLSAKNVAYTILNYGAIDLNLSLLIKCAKKEPEMIVDITNSIVAKCSCFYLIDYICEMYKKCQELGCVDGLFKSLKKQIDSIIVRYKTPYETDYESLNYYLKDIKYTKDQLRRILNIPGLTGKYKSCVDDLLVGLDQCESKINSMIHE